LITKAVSDLETFYVDETVRSYFDTANGTVLPAYARAISTPSATSWQTFDSEAYSLIGQLYSAMTKSDPKRDRYSHELGGLYNTILPLYLAVHLNGARWGITPSSTTSKTLLDDVVETAKNAIALDYNLVGSKLRWTYGSNPKTLADDTRQSVLFKYIKANYDNNYESGSGKQLCNDDLCAVFFQTDATVQAVQIGGLGIYKTLAYSAQNTGGAQNMDLVVDIASGVTVRLDPDTSWGHNWAGYDNAVWTPMYHDNNGQWVTGRSCPRDCGIVAMWNVPHDPWHVGFLCQKWPAAPACPSEKAGPPGRPIRPRRTRPARLRQARRDHQGQHNHHQGRRQQEGNRRTRQRDQVRHRTRCPVRRRTFPLSIAPEFHILPRVDNGSPPASQNFDPLGGKRTVSTRLVRNGGNTAVCVP